MNVKDTHMSESCLCKGLLHAVMKEPFGEGKPGESHGTKPGRARTFKGGMVNGYVESKV